MSKMLPSVVLVTLNYNRHTLTERAIRCFLEQDYKGEHTMFIYNTGAAQDLEDIKLPKNKNIVLVNNTKDLDTGEPYTSVGAKHKDALRLLDKEYDIVSFYDNDDIILMNHITEGVRGLQKAYDQDKLAYKPEYSYFLNKDVISLMNNNFEGSIFLNFNLIKSLGFLDTTVTYHNSWFLYIQKHNKLLVEKEGKATWCYTWGEPIFTWKTSGGADNTTNFINSQAMSHDIGDSILTPWDKSEINYIYNYIKELYVKEGQTN